MTMKLNRYLLSASLALIGSIVTPAIADEWNKETKLTFSAPVAVPGKVLDAGKYVFRLADSQSDRNIVQVFSEDETGKQTFVTTILAIPDYRLTTPEKPIIQFEERQTGSPEAIKSWFYPGDNQGWQFVYSKSERLNAGAAVASASAPAPTPVEPPAPPAFEPPSATTDLIVIDKEEAVTAEFEAPQIAPSEEIQSSDEQTLPKTAGYSAMLLVMAAMMLGAGLFVVSWSRRGA
jgi:hypothetical protein